MAFEIVFKNVNHEKGELFTVSHLFKEGLQSCLFVKECICAELHAGDVQKNIQYSVACPGQYVSHIQN